MLKRPSLRLNRLLRPTDWTEADPTPGTFSLKPTSRIEFTNAFLPYEGGITHQIGGCQIEGNLLYVGIGDGWQPLRAEKLDYMNGKLIRMTLDGKPVPGNPFFQNDDVTKSINYVWAYGLHNPFALKIVDGRIFVAYNGLQIDRFLEIKKGQNYRWNGSDEGIAANAYFVWVPSASPVRMDYSGSISFFPEKYQYAFFHIHVWRHESGEAAED